MTVRTPKKLLVAGLSSVVLGVSGPGIIPAQVTIEGDLDVGEDVSIDGSLTVGGLAIGAVGELAVRRVESVAALRAISGTGLTGGALVAGYYQAGDNGGGIFYWDSVSAAGDDGGLVFAPAVTIADNKRAREHGIRRVDLAGAEVRNVVGANQQIRAGEIKSHTPVHPINSISFYTTLGGTAPERFEDWQVVRAEEELRR